MNTYYFNLKRKGPRYSSVCTDYETSKTFMAESDEKARKYVFENYDNVLSKADEVSLHRIDRIEIFKFQGEELEKDLNRWRAEKEKEERRRMYLELKKEFE